MRVAYVIILIAAVIIAVIFAVQNSAPITVAFFGWSATASMSLVLVLTLGAGILIGMLILVPSIWKRMRALSVQKKKTREFQKQQKEDETSSTPEAAQAENPSPEQNKGK
ncbi:MAG: LapA family protein [Rectinema subterraneum]|uniref:LapA family protein n=1 Tax=Rectinema subterraneum TaxID=2653714 RepID=UPI003C7ACCB9